MSYLSNQTNQLYINFTEIGNGQNFAKTTRSFSNFIIQRSENWVMWVERFRLPIQAIAMREAENTILKLIPVGQDDGAQALNEIHFDLDNSYSVHNFLRQLNSFLPGALIFALTSDGRIRITYHNFTNYYIKLSQTLREIFDLPTYISDKYATKADGTFEEGASPFLDRFDQLDKIQIEAIGIPTESEFIGSSARGNIISDFLITNSYSLSASTDAQGVFGAPFNLSWSGRQEITYEPHQRRFINLFGVSGVRYVDIEAVAILKTGARVRIVLPPGSTFNLKIGFAKRQ